MELQDRTYSIPLFDFLVAFNGQCAAGWLVLCCLILNYTNFNFSLALNPKMQKLFS